MSPVFTTSKQYRVGINLVTQYQGPGDIVGGAVRWYGLRAYTSASVGTNVIRLRRDSDQSEQDIATVAGGGLDLAAISTFKGTANLFITKFYDQVGTNHMVQTTASQQAQLILSGLGSLPIAVYSSAASSGYLTSAAVAAQAQPFTISAVVRRTSNFTQQMCVWANSMSSIQLSFNTVSNSMFIYAGAGLGGTVTDNVYHAIQAVFNSTSSDVNVDGTVNTGDAGTIGQASSTNTIGTYDGTTTGTDGNILELGGWATAFTSTQSANMSSNQRGYWGF